MVGGLNLKSLLLKIIKQRFPETLTFTLINSNFGGTQYEGVNISVEIVDTSRPPTYELSSTSLAIDEGDSVTITLTTTNVDENVKVAYVLTNIVDLGIVDPSCHLLLIPQENRLFRLLLFPIIYLKVQNLLN